MGDSPLDTYDDDMKSVSLPLLTTVPEGASILQCKHLWEHENGPGKKAGRSRAAGFFESDKRRRWKVEVGVLLTENDSAEK